MSIRVWSGVLAAVVLLAAAAPAAEPQEPPSALTLVPQEAIAFFLVPNLQNLDDGVRRFTDRTGWRIGEGDNPVLSILARRTGIESGLDPKGSAAVAFLDPKRYRRRYTVYILPVADWDALLTSTRGEEMTPGLYALTGTMGPRYVARRGRLALVTSSVRTMDALEGAKGIASSLPPETRLRAAGPAPMLYLNVHRLKRIYESEITTWFRASSGQVYFQPEAVPYADMLVAYMLGIADFIDQMETFEATLRFGPEGLGVDLAVRFVEEGSVAELLVAQEPGLAPIPGLADAPLTSAVTVRLDPRTRTGLVLRMTRFFLDKAPRPEPLPEATKEEVYEAVRVLMESFGSRFTSLSAPAAPGQGLAAEVTVFDLRNPEQFHEGVALMAAAWERLADQLNLYLKFKVVPEGSTVAGVPVTLYIPRLRFGIPARHVGFRQRLRDLFGPEGLVYRIAVVGNRAVVTAGSDLTLFRRTIERLKAGQPTEPLPGAARLMKHLPGDRNVSIAMSLPLFVRQALVRGGMSPDRIGTVDPGAQMAGLGLSAVGPAAHLVSYWPHEQLRLARELLERAAPEAAEAPGSLFEPPESGPPAELAPPPTEAGEGETPPELAPPPTEGDEGETPPAPAPAAPPEPAAQGGAAPETPPGPAL